MSDRAFATLVPRLSASVSGCPQSTIVQYIRDAAIRTCERTLYWRHVVPLFNLVPNVSEYTYVRPAGTDVHNVFEVLVNDSALRRVMMEDVLQWSAATASGPQVFTQITPDRYVVLPPPDARITYQVRMFLALKPTRSATVMSETILNDLEEAIMHGALQHLLVLPNVAWADRELAAYHAKQYVFQVAERRARANLGNQGAPMRVRPQFF